MDAIKVVALTEIENKAKRACPVDTGRLRSSINTFFYRSTNYNYTDNNGNSFDGSIHLQVPENVVYVYTNVKYAQKQERRRPYLFPAFEASRIKLQQRIQAVLRTPPP